MVNGENAARIVEMPRKRTSGQASRPRSANWTTVHDETMLRILKHEYMLGNCPGGYFTDEAWKRITPTFNQQTGLLLGKANLKNRMKVLKKLYKLYNSLATRSGWHWDPDKSTPSPGDPSDWDRMIAVNPEYLKCRDRPFPVYKDIELLCTKETSVFKRSDVMAWGANVVRGNSFSSSDNDEKFHILAINQNNQRVSTPNALGINILPSDSLPTPPANGSPLVENHAQPINDLFTGHASSSEDRSNSSSSGVSKRRKAADGSKALDELIDIGRQRLAIAKELLEQESAVKPRVFSIGDCISKLDTLPGISTDAFLACCEAFKDEADRAIFMHLKEPVLTAWIDRQVPKHSFNQQLLHQFPQEQQRPPQQPQQ